MHNIQIHHTTKVSNERHVLCGSRLKELKSQLEWAAEALMVKFKKWGCYILTFSDGEEAKLLRIVHCATSARGDVGASHQFITRKTAKLINNHSGHDACFRIPALPDIPAIIFFDGGVGPKSYPFVGGGTSQEFNKVCKQMERAIEQERCKPADKVLTEVRKSAAIANKAKPSAVIITARANAKVRSEGTAMRREVSLG